MKCPKCKTGSLGVTDSRPAENGTCVRRRRRCGKCGETITTFEMRVGTFGLPPKPTTPDSLKKQRLNMIMDIHDLVKLL